MDPPSGTEKQTGLTRAEAEVRLGKFGRNTLPEKRPTPAWVRFVRQFKSPLIYILLFALIIDILIWGIEGADGIPIESVAIGLILLLNSGLGIYQENKAEAALDRLKLLAAPLVWVVRDGRISHIPASELVPGDVVRIEAGERVPADGDLLESQGVSVDESILTGESVPVEKGEGGELFSGTLLVRGKCYAAVTNTGEKSSMGRLAVMIGEIGAGKTPLERRLDVFGRQVAYAIGGLAVILILTGLYIEGTERLGQVLLFAVALAVAAVPEGLPAVLTLTLSLGVERMAKRKAVIRRLSAVEALGSVTVIATDKTGTLTENRMYVKDLDSPKTRSALLAMVLANDADLESGAGDPLEIALLEYARTQGIDPAAENRARPRKSVLPFDSKHKYMRVTVEEAGRQVSYLKGAPEVIIERSKMTAEERTNWEEKAAGYAADGFRVIALGWRDGESDDELHFGGLVLLWDPPRPEVPEAIRKAQDAGIRVVMITGDHPATAFAVANAVGIPPSRVLTGFDVDNLGADELHEAVKHCNIFARVSPEHKLLLVEALQAGGEIVAVTGDGVNDAPALKRSDVGVAMGERGSDVSREVADLVLLDDNIATIVAAIEEGRGIYENIQKFIRFFFSTDLALILLVVGGSVGSFILGLKDASGGLLLPLTAVQLLWINVIADGPPAIALGLDKNSGMMDVPPRDPSSPLLDRASLLFVALSGTIKAAVGIGLLISLPLLGYGVAAVRTAVFIFESIIQIVFAYPSRHISVLPQLNPTLHITVAAGIVLQIATLYVPFLRDMLGLAPLDAQILLITLASALGVWLVAETYSWYALRIGNNRHAAAAGR
ncbi:MAG: HAD-IC family P-type ATPase [Acidobacteria bacterium]|nr:HAD-IC family P-type ATPase [Acidobacteriota bacterium]